MKCEQDGGEVVLMGSGIGGGRLVVECERVERYYCRWRADSGGGGSGGGVVPRRRESRWISCES